MSHYSTSTGAGCGSDGRRRNSSGSSSGNTIKREPSFAGGKSAGATKLLRSTGGKPVPHYEEEEKYRALRKRNNIAVRKSREKQRAKQTEVVETLGALKRENSDLQATVASRIRELNLLKSLLRQVNHDPPERLSRILEEYNEEHHYKNSNGPEQADPHSQSLTNTHSSSSSSHRFPPQPLSAAPSTSASSSPSQQTTPSAASRLISTTTYGQPHPAHHPQQASPHLHNPMLQTSGGLPMGLHNHVHQQQQQQQQQHIGYAHSPLHGTPLSTAAPTPCYSTPATLYQHQQQPHSIPHASTNDMPLESRPNTTTTTTTTNASNHLAYNDYNGYFP